LRPFFRFVIAFKSVSTIVFSAILIREAACLFSAKCKSICLGLLILKSFNYVHVQYYFPLLGMQACYYGIELPAGPTLSASLVHCRYTSPMPPGGKLMRLSMSWRHIYYGTDSKASVGGARLSGRRGERTRELHAGRRAGTVLARGTRCLLS
jgi:hypothetical protein